MIFSGIKSLQYLPVSVFTLFKNFTSIIVASIEYKLDNYKFTNYSIVSFTLIIISSFAIDIADFQSSVNGYLYMTVNVVSTSFYVLYFRYALTKTDVDNLTAVFYSQALTIPFISILLIFQKEYLYFKYINMNFITLVLLSCIFIFLIAYSTTITLKRLSSTTLTMMGATNKFLMGFSGIIFLKEKNINFLKIFSIITGAISGMIYIFDDIFSKK